MTQGVSEGYGSCSVPPKPPERTVRTPEHPLPRRFKLHRPPNKRVMAGHLPTLTPSINQLRRVTHSSPSVNESFVCMCGVGACCCVAVLSLSLTPLLSSVSPFNRLTYTLCSVFPSPMASLLSGAVVFPQCMERGGVTRQTLLSLSKLCTPTICFIVGGVVGSG